MKKIESILPVIDFLKRINLKHEEKKWRNCGMQNIPVKDIVALSRPVDDKWHSCKEILKRLKNKKWRDHSLKHDYIQVHKYQGKYYVYNGNHRSALIYKYRKELGIKEIPAEVQEMWD